MAPQQQPTAASLPWDEINPYVSWALGPGRSYYFAHGKQTMPLLLQLKGKTAQAFLEGEFITDLARRARWREAFWVLCRRDGPSGKRDSVVWAAALASEEIALEIAAPHSRDAIEGASLGLALGTKAVEALKTLPRDMPKWMADTKAIKPAADAANPPAVVIGVIDDGIAFLHERFQKSGRKTRIEGCWLQDPGIFQGKGDIDALLASGTDENQLYRVSGAVDFVTAGHKSITWRMAHGTHVMDLACGYDPAMDEDRRPIACVQLPPKVTAAEEPWSLSWHIALGMIWIIHCATKIASDRQVAGLVINISYGLLGGWHAGLDLLEQFIEDVTEFYRLFLDLELRVVLPSGNSYLSRGHGQIRFTALGQSQVANWRIQPDDRTPSFLEVWLPAAIPLTSRLTLTITSPNGVVRTIKEHGAAVLFGPAGSEYAHAAWLKVPTPAPGRAVFVVMVQPTAQPDPNQPVVPLAPAGTWTVDLAYTGNLQHDKLVHVWIRRDDQIFGYSMRGRQSRLEDVKYIRLDHAGRDKEDDVGGGFVRREYTLSSMATGNKSDDVPIVIGGYLGKQKVAAKYSAAGAIVSPMPPPPPPHKRGPQRAPDAMAVSEDSRVHGGVLAAGSRSGSVVAMGGTSVAAPQIARIIADNLAAAGPGDHAWVRGQADPPGMPPPPKPPEERGGAGRIVTKPIVAVKRFE